MLQIRIVNSNPHYAYLGAPPLPYKERMGSSYITWGAQTPDTDHITSVIMDSADNISYSEAISSADEGIKFTVPANDPKSDVLSPYDPMSFTRYWECWDTEKNQILNFGPITEISDSGESYQVTGGSRSSLLQDYFQNLKTFYARIDSVVEEVRFENIAAGPSTRAVVSNFNEDDTAEQIVLPSVGSDEKYHNLSKRSANFVIDDQTGYVPIGKIEPPRDFVATAEYWSGTSFNDSLMLDFGDNYPITKLRYLFPWWGGVTSANDRTYDFTISVSVSGSSIPHMRGIDADTGYNMEMPIAIFDSLSYFGEPNRIVTTPPYPMDFYIGATASGAGVNLNTFNILQGQDGPLVARYLITNVNGVHAWYGSDLDTNISHDGYDFQCDPEYRPGNDPYFGSKTGVMAPKNKKGQYVPKSIPETVLKPANDCHASIVEIGAYQEIIPKKNIKALALQKIDNNNRQISYSHTVQDSENFRVKLSKGNYVQKFEPGSFFRKFMVSWLNATTTYTQFYSTDCVNCYPDGFTFGIIDDDNTLIYHSDLKSSGTNINVNGRQYTKHVMMKGASNGGRDAHVVWADCWKGITDPLSYGGSYSMTNISGDWFKVHFRGESFRWFSSIPDGKTGATVKIEIRHKLTTLTKRQRLGIDNKDLVIWGSWTTLESNFKIPDGGYTNKLIYEIPYRSSILQPETVYEIKVTLLDGNYCSVDSIEGYWSASFTEYNEDSNRIKLSRPSAFTQIYDKRFTEGSMYKWNTPGVSANINFEGDRIIVQSAKGRYHGHLTLIMFQYREGIAEYDPGTENHVFIPGGNPDTGALTIDLDTGKRGQEVPNYIIFDSNDYFGEYGLPWGRYTLAILNSPAAKYYTTKDETGSSSFVYRCKNCKPSSSKQAYIYEYVYLDAIGVHERISLSVNFDQKSHLDIINSITEAIQVEWHADVDGLVLDPRIGSDTDVYLREGADTLVNFQIVNDISRVATRLLSYGTSIDGIDMFSITEDKTSRNLFGRTITRQNDFRDIASYEQLIGLSRTELKRRNRPDRRITVTHVARDLNLSKGDSFVLWTRKGGARRVRIQRMEISESSSGGRKYNMECVEWPQIV